MVKIFVFAGTLMVSFVVVVFAQVRNAGNGAAAAGLDVSAIRPPSEMGIELSSEISKRKATLPAIVTLSYSSDETRHLTNYSFLFLLLDENGKQVAANPLIREAVSVDIQLAGKLPTYTPRLALNRLCEQLVTGKRYQLVCVLLNGNIASSAWFKLVE